MGASINSFASGLPAEFALQPGGALPALSLSEGSEVVNIILHTIYNMSCVPFRPSLDTLISAISALTKYGIPVTHYVKPSTPLYVHILWLTPLCPMDVYIASATNGLDDLAVSTSSCLLSFDLSAITDPMAEAMGPVYLKRLFLLHQDRLKVLKDLFLEGPKHHEPTLHCGFRERQALTRAWVLASSSFAWEGRPGKQILVIFVNLK